MHVSELDRLIARQRPGWSLEQPFYVSDGLYEVERHGWLAAQWYVIAHGSELPAAGAFIVRELLGESLLIARDDVGSLRGFYNVCRHRGSRLCDQDGRAPRGFTCPYHAWSYRLDGTLRKVAAMPEGVDLAELGLRPVPVREIGGVVLVSLSGDVAIVDNLRAEWEPGLAYHGLTRARIAARRHYPTAANWKLVLENFRECYHCYHAHPEYCGVMQWVDTTARTAPDAAERWSGTVAAWAAHDANPESPLPTLASLGDLATGAMRHAFRTPIGHGHQTQSEHGAPVAPLMGAQPRFDGGVSHFLLRPFVTVMASNDHAVLFQFLPLAAQHTDVVVTWLVDAEARDADVDVARLIWLWDTTTIQDTRLIERNAAGVRSRAYVPGPYSTLEHPTAQLVDDYLRSHHARMTKENPHGLISQT